MALRVLIADDSSSARDLIRFHMQRFGYEVVAEAENGAEAVTLFKTLRPDVVTLDLVMPSVNGIDALAAFRLIKKEDPLVAIVVVSAIPFDKTRHIFIKEGALTYMVKPFNKFYFDELQRKLERKFSQNKPPGLLGLIRKS
jgi:two-component system chemotaxis response regulator CheY